MKFFKMISMVSIVLLMLASCSKMETGTVNGGVYINSWADIMLEAPDGWSFMGYDEIAHDIGVSSDADNDNNKESSYSMYYTFMLESDDGSSSIVMTVEDLSATDGGIWFSASDYLDIIAAGMESDTTVEFICQKGEPAEMAGSSYETLDVKAVLGTASLEQRYYVRKKGKYMICITCSSTKGIDEACSIAESIQLWSD